MPTATEMAIAQWEVIAQSGGAARLEQLFHAPGAQHAAIRSAMERLRPASVVEIGCSVGVNLAAATELGIRRLCGIDLDAPAVTFAAERIDGLFLIDDLRRAVHELPSRSWDVALSCYTLAYISPEEIAGVFHGFASLARRALIVAEPSDRLAGTPTPWAHDYVTLGRRAGFEPRAAMFIPPVDGLSAISIWERA